ncbi:hypothetical protein Bbelb_001320 [Branchiostoma belcheri]|nr:hypothetical protein Bbelb_001320 [Branchiostoma belcheri]
MQEGYRFPWSAFLTCPLKPSARLEVGITFALFCVMKEAGDDLGATGHRVPADVDVTSLEKPHDKLHWVSLLRKTSESDWLKTLDDFRVDCELCRHWGLSRRTGAKQNCAGGVEERRGRSRFFAGAKQNGAGAKQNGGGEEEGEQVGSKVGCGWLVFGELCSPLVLHDGRSASPTVLGLTNS